MKKLIVMHKHRNGGIPSRLLWLNWVVVIAVVCGGSSRQFVSAQIVSNLDEVANSADSVTSTLWRANRFTTGNNAGGYTLDSVIGRFSAQTTAGTFIAQIYSDNESRPNVSLESLTGAAPATAGDHTFSSAGLSLDANTSYWIAWTATSGQYTPENTFSNSETSTDGWTIGGSSASGDAGGNWTAESGPGARLFSIQATPVPEPHEYAMFVGLGLMVFVGARRHLVSKALA